MEWLSGLVDYGVLGVLCLLCFIVVMLSVERFLFFRSINIAEYSSKKYLELQLSNNIQIIGTIASNAPYIGLLGTVLGIMLTFYTIGMNTTLEAGTIMVSLALALKATAAGLVVAMIAVVSYNILSRKARRFLLEWEISHEG